jgi:hypothetical protein
VSTRASSRCKCASERGLRRDVDRVERAVFGGVDVDPHAVRARLEIRAGGEVVFVGRRVDRHSCVALAVSGLAVSGRLSPHAANIAMHSPITAANPQRGTMYSMGGNLAKAFARARPWRDCRRLWRGSAMRMRDRGMIPGNADGGWPVRP